MKDIRDNLGQRKQAKKNRKILNLFIFGQQTLFMINQTKLLKILSSIYKLIVLIHTLNYN
jgi:hypothetical protein